MNCKDYLKLIQEQLNKRFEDQKLALELHKQLLLAQLKKGGCCDAEEA